MSSPAGEAESRPRASQAARGTVCSGLSRPGLCLGCSVWPQGSRMWTCSRRASALSCRYPLSPGSSDVTRPQRRVSFRRRPPPPRRLLCWTARAGRMSEDGSYRRSSTPAPLPHRDPLLRALGVTPDCGGWGEVWLLEKRPRSLG